MTNNVLHKLTAIYSPTGPSKPLLTSHTNRRYSILCILQWNNPDSKVHGANMGPIWGRQDPGGPQVGPMDFVIWEYTPKMSSSLF